MAIASVRMPTFLGVGAKKCATTWISECLRHHPEVYMSSPKEIHFFSTERRWSSGLDWYLDHFRGSEGYKAVGEFSPSYLVVGASVDRIQASLGDVRILASLRDPVARFVSEYKQHLRSGSFPAGARNLDLDTFRWATARKPRLLQNGLYADGLERYRRAFGRDRVCVVLKEDIDREPHGVLRTLYAFVGVDDGFVPPLVDKVTSPGIVPRIQWLETLREKTYRTLNRIDPRLVVLTRKLRVAEVYRYLNGDRRNNRFTVAPEVYDALEEYYAPDIARLEDLLGRPLTAWQRT